MWVLIVSASLFLGFIYILGIHTGRCLADRSYNRQLKELRAAYDWKIQKTCATNPEFKNALVRALTHLRWSSEDPCILPEVSIARSAAVDALIAALPEGLRAEIQSALVSLIPQERNLNALQ
ncbi:MAG: hypothetical protein N2248_00310 [candidate division WOR-3 bacterium]|nr:hypothetical protein [candidate division WOR-3 bacterium]